ncbi:MAG: DEAD/DEAH box helicase [Candidatus Diapherotrites archaeon]
MPTYVTHPLITPNKVERRLYQEVVVAQVEEKGNTLVVAPTALGKTVMGVLLCARMLQHHPDKKILFLAPTKPLAVQHQERMREFLTLHPESIAVLTGTLPPEKRREIWDHSTIITATPQTIENDVLTGKLDLNEVQLVVFDEAHRAVKEYSYVFLAQKYMQSHASTKCILALTASPGSNEEDIHDICRNLFIQNIYVKTLEDADVKPYMNDIKVEWKKVTLSPEYHAIKKHFQSFMEEQINFFKKIGYGRQLHASYLRRQDLLALQEKLRQDMLNEGKQKPYLYSAVSRAAAIMKVSHGITLLESQGVHALLDYLNKMVKESGLATTSKATRFISGHPEIVEAMKKTRALAENNGEHPKMGELTRILSTQFSTFPDSRVLVFNHYRDSATHVTEILNQNPSIRAARFIGQATKSEKDKGLSQKEQIKRLEAFKKGEFNTLIASSVAEEGLDIPSVDLVVFYEPVPSEIRLIQRRGRTGRKSAGKVIILMAEKTMDEAMYWSSRRKEKTMHETLRRLSTRITSEWKPKQRPIPQSEKGQAKLSLFDGEKEKFFIFADTREQASSVMRELSFYPDLRMHVKQLEVGDFVVGENVVIERKTIEDFLQSLIDGRLLGQLLSMSQAYAKPLLFLEGKPEELFTKRNIHENAVIGTLTTIALTYRIPILFTQDAQDTAKFIHQIAKKEQENKESDIRIRLGRKGLSLNEQQRFIVEGLPNIGPTAAHALLEHFGNIQAIINAEEKDLIKVEKIGPKKAKNIVNVLTQKYESNERKRKKETTQNEKENIPEKKENESSLLQDEESHVPMD